MDYASEVRETTRLFQSLNRDKVDLDFHISFFGKGNKSFQSLNRDKVDLDVRPVRCGDRARRFQSLNRDKVDLDWAIEPLLHALGGCFNPSIGIRWI